MDRILAELETDQDAILVRLPAAGEPQRHERVPAAVKQPRRGAVMLEAGEQLELAEIRSQPRRTSALDKRLLHDAQPRLGRRRGTAVLMLPVATDQRRIEAPADAGLTPPGADGKPVELAERDQQLRRVGRRQTGAVHLVIDRRDPLQLFPEPALPRSFILVIGR